MDFSIRIPNTGDTITKENFRQIEKMIRYLLQATGVQESEDVLSQIRPGAGIKILQKGKWIEIVSKGWVAINEDDSHPDYLLNKLEPGFGIKLFEKKIQGSSAYKIIVEVDKAADLTNGKVKVLIDDQSDYLGNKIVEGDNTTVEIVDLNNTPSANNTYFYIDATEFESVGTITEAAEIHNFENEAVEMDVVQLESNPAMGADGGYENVYDCTDGDACLKFNAGMFEPFIFHRADTDGWTIKARVYVPEAPSGTIFEVIYPDSSLTSHLSYQIRADSTDNGKCRFYFYYGIGNGSSIDDIGVDKWWNITFKAHNIDAYTQVLMLSVNGSDYTYYYPFGNTASTREIQYVSGINAINNQLYDYMVTVGAARRYEAQAPDDFFNGYIQYVKIFNRYIDDDEAPYYVVKISADDEKVKVSETDETSGFLTDKLLAGENVELTIEDGEAEGIYGKTDIDQTVTIDVPDAGLVRSIPEDYTAGALSDELVAGDLIEFTPYDDYAINETELAIDGLYEEAGAISSVAEAHAISNTAIKCKVTDVDGDLWYDFSDATYDGSNNWTDGIIKFGNVLGILANGDFTITIKAKLHEDDTNRNIRLFQIYKALSQTVYITRVNDSGTWYWRFVIYNSVDPDFCSVEDVWSTDDPYTITIQRSANSLSLWVNDSNVATGTYDQGAIAWTSVYTAIGGRDDNGANYDYAIKGMIQYCKVWDSAIGTTVHNVNYNDWKTEVAFTGEGTDEKVKISSNDTTADYLNGKLVAGTGISLTEGNDGGDETLTIAATQYGYVGTKDVDETDIDDGKVLAYSTASGKLEYVVGGGAGGETVKVSSDDTTPGYLNGKLVAGDGITLTETDGGGDETLEVSADVPAINTNTTVNFDNSMSAAEIQALIDAQPKCLNANLTFQFADGAGVNAYSLAASLTFSGFYGGGTLYIQGNTSDADPASSSVELNFSDTNGIVVSYTTCFFYVRYLHAHITAQSATRYGIWCYRVLSAYINNNYLKFTASGGGVDITYGFGIMGQVAASLYVDGNKFNSGNTGIHARYAVLLSNGNASDTNNPKYGLYGHYASKIGKNGTQPTGGTSNEITVGGGEIRGNLSWVDDGTSMFLGTSYSAPAISDGTGIDVNGKILRLRTSKTPASSTDTGNAGEICWDANYLYVCTATNTWKKFALTTSGSSPLIPDRTYLTPIVEDMYSNPSAELVGSAVNSGTTGTITSTANHPGVVYARTHASTGNSGYKWITNAYVFVLSGGETANFIFNFQGTRTDEYVRLGFFDSNSNTTPTSGAYLNLSHDGTNVIVSGKTYSASSSSTTGTTYSGTSNTWYRGEIVVNSDATSIAFSVYNESGTSLWSSSLTTNIPTAALYFGVIAWEAAVASANDVVHMDLISLHSTRVLAR